MKNLQAIIIASRPKQWVKNGLVFFGLLFSGRFTEIQNIKTSILAFVIFILISASVYIFNDINDKHRDKLHHKKKKRPIASGAVSVPIASVSSVVIMSIALYLGYTINKAFFLTLLAYLIINLGYSLFFKNYIIIDAFFISSGYLIRTLAGVFAMNMIPTIWILISILFASLFIGFSKRRGEMVTLGINAGNHRKNLEVYTIEFLNAMIFINAGIALVAYLLFVIYSTHEHQLMVITVPFIIFTVFRYIFLVFTTDKADSPELLLLSDKSLLISNIIWLILFILTKLDYLGKYQLFKLD